MCVTKKKNVMILYDFNVLGNLLEKTKYIPPKFT